LERVAIQGKNTADQYEQQYQRLLEEFIKKLEIQITKNLDALQDQLHFSRDTVLQTSDTSLQALLLRSEQARTAIQSTLQSYTKLEIQAFLQRRQQLRIDRTHATLGFEQLRTLDLKVYSTVGKIDENEGCTNIPERQTFRQQIQQTKQSQKLKRVVYLDNRVLQ
jgi:hypothetical protein